VLDDLLEQVCLLDREGPVVGRLGHGDRSMARDESLRYWCAKCARERYTMGPYSAPRSRCGQLGEHDKCETRVWALGGALGGCRPYRANDNLQSRAMSSKQCGPPLLGGAALEMRPPRKSRTLALQWHAGRLWTHLVAWNLEAELLKPRHGRGVRV
jgi:hypothetical protein